LLGLFFQQNLVGRWGLFATKKVMRGNLKTTYEVVSAIKS
jgi:hypothetical protein